MQVQQQSLLVYLFYVLHHTALYFATGTCAGAVAVACNLTMTTEADVMLRCVSWNDAQMVLTWLVVFSGSSQIIMLDL